MTALSTLVRVWVIGISSISTLLTLFLLIRYPLFSFPFLKLKQMVSDILSSFYVYQTELQIRAPFKGIVQRIVTNGKSLDENEVIAELEEL